MKKISIGFILFFIGICFFLYQIMYADFSFTVLPYKHNEKNSSIEHTKELYVGQSVKGTFIALDHYLALIGIRFNTFDRENDDVIKFRVKEKGSPRWITEQQIRTTLGNNDIYYFGISPIEASKNRIYELEIISIRGKKNSAIAISSQQPQLITRYQFPKKLLIKNPGLLISFMTTKISNHLFEKAILFSGSVFFLPFFLFTLFHLVFKKSSLYWRYFVIALTLLLIFINVIVINKIIDLSLVFTAIIWLFVNKNIERVSFIFGVMLLILSTLLYVLNFQNGSHILISWSFLFMIIFLLENLFKQNFPL